MRPLRRKFLGSNQTLFLQLVEMLQPLGRGTRGWAGGRLRNRARDSAGADMRPDRRPKLLRVGYGGEDDLPGLRRRLDTEVSVAKHPAPDALVHRDVLHLGQR